MPNPTTFNLGGDVAVSSTTVGENVYYVFHVDRDAKYTIETKGTANATLGIWGPFSDASAASQGDRPPYGRVAVNGVAKWGSRTLAPGYYCLRVTLSTSGSYGFKVRPWQFTDYIMTKLHS